MPNREHFRELSALAAIGQLSLEEDHELTAHLRECEDCRNAHNDYARVVVRELPLADAVRSRMRPDICSTLPAAELRDRFLARARSEGVDFSLEAQRPQRPEQTRFGQKIGWRYALAVAAATILGVLGASIAAKYRPAPRPTTPSAQDTILTKQNEALRAQLAVLRNDLGRNAIELDKARREAATSHESLAAFERHLAESRAQTDHLSALLQDLEAKQKQLEAENQGKDQLIADLKSKNEALHRDNADNLSTRIILESQIRDLKETLQQQTASLERERQLMAVSKDVRQLISARSLHILDVHDVDGGGKDSKAFGRVFYAEGQALVFYAFDLPSGKLSPAKYTFEAWGQKEYVEHSVRNLGTFEVDDHDQRRWVLKVTDPVLLRGIDSVFVTAEAVVDARAPKGRKLLYAYIVGQPNHP